MSVTVKIFQLSFCVFICAFPAVIYSNFLIILRLIWQIRHIFSGRLCFFEPVNYLNLKFILNPVEESLSVENQLTSQFDVDIWKQETFETYSQKIQVSGV